MLRFDLRLRSFRNATIVMTTISTVAVTSHAFADAPPAYASPDPAEAVPTSEPVPGTGPTPTIAPTATPAPETTPATEPEAFEPRIPGADNIEDPFLRALVGGAFDLSIRWRYEYADIDGFDESNALTMRTRLGYTTGTFAGFQGAIQLEDNRALDDEAYNAAGLNNEPDRAVIADPEDTELNQLWIDYDFRTLAEELALSGRVGRQRIILDDARFVGNVGWRQLEQTYDGAALTAEPVDGLKAFYAYLWEVNRIFGPDADRDFDSNSHLVNIAYSKLPIGTITGFAYLLDLEDGGEAVSSQTYGFRLTGDRPVAEGLALGYLVSAAWQTDYADNPTDYGAPYLRLEGELVSDDGPFGGLGFELLGSDDGDIAVSTPLAMLHAFNGFADAFVNTPDVGLRDYYGFVGTTLPEPFNGKATLWYHHFTGDDDTDPLGWELDAVVSHRFNDYLTGLVKWAYFDGDEGLADIHRFWVQLELAF